MVTRCGKVLAFFLCLVCVVEKTGDEVLGISIGVHEVADMV
jgi:hypothetical protein